MEAVDLSKIASCAQMSDHDDFRSDGDWDNVALFNEDKAKLAAPFSNSDDSFDKFIVVAVEEHAPTINDDSFFDKFINVQVHAHQGKTWGSLPLEAGRCTCKARGQADW